MHFRISLTILLLILITIISCKEKGEPRQDTLRIDAAPDDAHSYADNSAARMTHLSLDLTVDFDHSVLWGSATLQIAKNGADSLFLDSNDLKIDSVTSGARPVKYSLAQSEKFLGSKIAISSSEFTDSVTIYYSTSPDAAALQWLKPEQTFGKKYPFLYTQGEAILTRSWIPLQDSPGIRFTYDATIKAPDRLLALMSAENPQARNNSGVYHFRMKEAIPSYLVALAVGDLNFQAFDDRSGVYAEPGQLGAAAYEFSETPAMIHAAEALYGPYVWGRYDILVLPPAFPFGGMENPRLTFATPTVIAGDRSLANLIAHELAHSWSGNLVTNGTWDDFWLNEGFTVYFERRIVEQVKNKDYADMNSIIGRNDLDNSLAEFGLEGPETRLKLDLKGQDPDDGMTDVAYEKGYLFIVLLERTFGREALDRFLKDYFGKFKFQTITTSQFEQYLYTQFDPKKLDGIQVRDWFYQTGLPDNTPLFESKLFAAVDSQEVILLTGRSKLHYKDWDFNQWLYFLRKIKGRVTVEQLNRLDAQFGFSKSGNTEIQAIWLEDNIVAKNKAVNDQLAAFLDRVGRRKFLMPLYKALVTSGQADVAREIYRKSRVRYHSVSQNSLDELLGYPGKD